MINNENDSPISFILFFFLLNEVCSLALYEDKRSRFTEAALSFDGRHEVKRLASEEYNKIDLLVYCMLVSKHGFLVIPTPLCKCCMFFSS